MGTAASSLPAARDELHGDAIKAEQTKVVYRYLPVLIAINAVVGVATAYGLFGRVAFDSLLAWLVGLLLAQVARVALYVVYRRRADEQPGERWRLWFTIGSGVTGALWGAAGVALLPSGELEYQLFVLFVLVGMGAGAVLSLTAHMPAFYAFFPVSMLPVSLTLFRQADAIHIALGAMTVTYVVALLFIGRTYNRTLRDSLGLQFANMDLVDQLSAQRDEAQHANIGKSKFLAAASHDLRQPLHALTLFTTALDERITFPEVRRIVDSINICLRALERLFNALLDISRLDAGVLQPDRGDFPLDVLTEHLVNEYTPEAASKALRLVRIPSALVVRSDRALLERILRNYLSNAIRYTQRGEVRIAAVPTNGDVRIDVTDTGIGIDPSQHRAIFHEFHQLGNPERDRTKGLGLGLAIVERVARLLGHPISVESAPGRGSRFSVTVPLGDAQAVVAPSSLAIELQQGLENLCVVVVDDEISVRDGMATLLQQWGCRAIVAGSEDEAVDALQGGPSPDAIVVDYRLRAERTGLQAIARLRAIHGSDIPALIVTGDTAPETLREVLASGHSLVHKPLRPAVLRTFLRKAHLNRPGRAR